MKAPKTATLHVRYDAGPGYQDVEGGTAMPEEQRIRFWSDTNVPVNIKERLSGQLIEVYIQLDNLIKFVELNHDGFRYGCNAHKSRNQLA